MKTHCTDIIVTGGGMSGVAAALAAARHGAQVTLIEGQGCLGGMGTAGLVPAFAPYNFGIPEGQPLIRGIAWEVLEKLREAGGVYDTSRYWWLFDKEIAKVVLDRLVLDAGIHLRFFTTFSRLERTCSRIDRIITAGKNGEEAWTASKFIDTTGDGDLCAAAEVPFEMDETMPPTLCFIVDGVDRLKVPDVKPIAEAMYKGKAEGKLTNPQDFRGCKDLFGPHMLVFNYNHVYGVNSLNADDLTRTMVEGRRIAFELLEYLRREVPGFEKAYLVTTAALPGVRETRRIRGEFCLTAEAYFNAETHDDDICVYDYPADLHQAANTFESRERFEKLYYHSRIPAGKYYGIPYRCLLPVGIDNLAMAGRCVSCDRVMLSSLRVMPPCMAMGEAVGTAAVMAGNAAFKNVPPADLRNELIKSGAFLP
jgi:hypothetical protein